MRRPVWYRALIAVWGLWFTTALIEPAGLFACAVHGSHSASATPDAAATDHSMHAGGGGAVASHATQPADSDSSHSHCTCLDHGCCAVAAAVGATPIVVSTGELLQRTTVRFQTDDDVAVQRAHALPFANGPPATATR
jgi:hypothetical protein